METFINGQNSSYINESSPILLFSCVTMSCFPAYVERSSKAGTCSLRLPAGHFHYCMFTAFATLQKTKKQKTKRQQQKKIFHLF